MERESLHRAIEELRANIDVNAGSLRAEIRALAKGVDGLRETFTLGFQGVYEELAELKAVIRLSFNELDRRIQSR